MLKAEISDHRTRRRLRRSFAQLRFGGGGFLPLTAGAPAASHHHTSRERARRIGVVHMTEVKEHHDAPAGAPPIHYHDEGGLNSSNAAGGQVNRNFEPGWERAKRGENSAPPV